MWEQATQHLELVYKLLFAGFFADLLILPLFLWWIRKWRAVRKKARITQFETNERTNKL